MSLLQDKIAVITGSTRGFGLAIAQAYAREGAAVVISSRTQEAVYQVVQSLKSLGATASGLACDVSNQAQVQALADHATNIFGHFDIWVNNAGLPGPYGPTIHLSPEAFIQVTQTNILGTYYGSLVAMRHFLERRSGKLINILGRGARGPVPMQNAYAPSKAWILSFTKALAQEYKDSGVGVYALSPGMMDTDMLRKVEVVAGYEASLKSMGTVIRLFSQLPEAPARRAVWLASSSTDEKTGLAVNDMSMLKILHNILGEGINRLLGRSQPPVEVHLTSIPGVFPPGKE